MSQRRKKCRSCGELFRPHPQTYRQQITCSKKSCCAWRRRRKWRLWAQKDPVYADSRRSKLRRWRVERGAAYMRDYRRSHGAYVERNRRLQRERDRKRRFLVKPTAWESLCREKRRRNRVLRRLVKPTEWPTVLWRELDGIWGSLSRVSILVKPTGMA